jgi:hypothetical protein
VKDENGDLLADYHNILNRWKKYFSQLLNVNNVSDVRQEEFKRRLNSGNACYHSVQNLLSSRLLSKKN